MIACVRIPYFLTALESRDRPDIAEASFVLVRSQDSRREVLAVSQKADEQGVRSGMMLTQAQAICPDIRVLPARPSYYERATHEILETLSYFSSLIEVENGLELRADGRPRKHGLPVVHPLQTDAQSSAIIYIDLGKVSEEEVYDLAHLMHESLGQLLLAVAIGIAANKFAARVLAASLNVREVFALARGKEAEFLKNFPVSLLPVDGETLRQLSLLGLESLGQLAELSVSAMQNQFGKHGRTVHRLATGRDTSVVLPYKPKVAERAVHNFDDPVEDRAMIENVLQSMTSNLATRLESKGEMARKIGLVISTQSREIIERGLVLREPVTGKDLLFSVVKELSQTVQVSGAVTNLEIILSEIGPLVGRQMSLFEREPVSQIRLRQVLRDLVARYGEDSFYLLKLTNQDAHLPERRFVIEKAASRDIPVA